MDVQLAGLIGAPALFGICLVTGILIPVPEDVPVLAAGIAAQTGVLHPVSALAAAIAGVFCRDCLFFAAGRLLGEQVLVRPGIVRLLGASRIDRARQAVGGAGPRAVLLGRFLIGFRTPVFLAAGALGVPPSRFVLWDLLGLSVMIPAIFGLGYLLGRPAMDWLQWGLAHTGWLVPAVVVLAVVLALLRRRTRPDHTTTV
jgi:membrane protein DedA with SNARE-associated domain